MATQLCLCPHAGAWKSPKSADESTRDTSSHPHPRRRARTPPSATHGLGHRHPRRAGSGAARGVLGHEPAQIVVLGHGDRRECRRRRSSSAHESLFGGSGPNGHRFAKDCAYNARSADVPHEGRRNGHAGSHGGMDGPRRRRHASCCSLCVHLPQQVQGPGLVLLFFGAIQS